MSARGYGAVRVAANGGHGSVAQYPNCVPTKDEEIALTQSSTLLKWSEEKAVIEMLFGDF